MSRERHERWRWIVGAVIVAAAMIGGAFITRGTPEHRSAISFEARALGVTASIAVSL